MTKYGSEVLSLDFSYFKCQDQTESRLSEVSEKADFELREANGTTLGKFFTAFEAAHAFSAVDLPLLIEDMEDGLFQEINVLQDAFNNDLYPVFWRN